MQGRSAGEQKKETRFPPETGFLAAIPKNLPTLTGLFGRLDDLGLLGGIDNDHAVIAGLLALPLALGLVRNQALGNALVFLFHFDDQVFLGADLMLAFGASRALGAAILVAAVLVAVAVHRAVGDAKI